MQDIVISVHIPKTGGTSFRHVLEDTYKGRIFEDYDWNKRPAPLDGRLLQGTDDEIRKALKGVSCIHGHFAAEKYLRLREIDGFRPIFITWLRDPVERAVSSYYFLRTNPSGLPLDKMPAWERDAATMSVDEFLLNTRYGANRQAAQLRNVPIEQFDFIGLTEAYDASIEVFSHLFRKGRALPAMPVERKNPDRKGDRYDIPATVRKALVDMNANDVALYRYGKAWVHGASRMLSPI